MNDFTIVPPSIQFVHVLTQFRDTPYGNLMEIEFLLPKRMARAALNVYIRTEEFKTNIAEQLAHALTMFWSNIPKLVPRFGSTLSIRCTLLPGEKRIFITCYLPSPLPINPYTAADLLATAEWNL